MFERFTKKARAAVEGARAAAIDRGDASIGTEHLLLALTATGGGLASQVLADVGVTTERVAAQIALRAREPAVVTPEDLEVLKEMGIDAGAILDEARSQAADGSADTSATDIARAVVGAPSSEEPEVRSRIAAALSRHRAGLPPAGPKTVPFTPKAKKVLEYSLREALSLKDNYIGTEHLLLGLVRQGGSAVELLGALNVDLEDMRRRAIAARPGAS